MLLTEKERGIIRHALKELIQQFVGKEEIGEQYWPEEQKYQAAVKRLAKKMGAQ